MEVEKVKINIKELIKTLYHTIMVEKETNWTKSNMVKIKKTIIKYQTMQ